jgi:hypothetical protein
VRDIVRDGNFLFLCSHHVLHVPQVYNGSPRVFSIATHFIPYSLPKPLPFLTYIATPSLHRSCYFGEPLKFQWFG